MKRGTVILFMVLVAAGACGGDALGDEPPWGLDRISMPDTDEEVRAVIAALPDVIDGRLRTGGGAYETFYGESSWGTWAISAAPPETPRVIGVGRVGTIREHLVYLASGQAGVTVETSSVDPGGEVMWVAAYVVLRPLDPPGLLYELYWAQPGGSWSFHVVADSKAGRAALVEAFVAAAGG